ncbi:carboxypeptidase Y-deficient [Scheffersomyces spartinae]|uniref:Carboxypeptidase Y-deficient n=1 Tax=Scheffersomyces spartinae TaxID=45513 RepID=A0A9P8AIF8_9ASCO|nr:carboxypeptidase Y-deficient [Scheffersomyces spartinae]KAG7193813.1 carboxypeptidase Y-deficient [Scheffersomyces spartinae]
MSTNSPELRRNKRVLGSPFKSPVKNLANIDAASPSNDVPHNNSNVTSIRNDIDHPSVKNKEIKPILEIFCPICKESMISLNQLNQHIDDEHQKTDEQNLSPEPPVVRRELQIDLLNGDKGFSLSIDEGRKNGNENIRAGLKLSRDANPLKVSPSPSPGAGARGSLRSNERLSRNHWQTPASGSKCSIEGCNKTLSVKQGIVNCRRCGKLFCNVHTNFKVRLRNGPDSNSIPIFESLKYGIWSRVCRNCYNDKLDSIKIVEPKVEDLTGTFKRIRMKKNEDKELMRNKIKKRFIKLVELLVDEDVKKKQRKSQISKWNLFGGSDTNEPTVLEQAIEIVGHDNWMEDSKTHNCTICYIHFNMITRKHHCRLCGSIVCDDLFGERKLCSIMVPINQLLDKLKNLNYGANARSQFLFLLLNECSIRFRCCINCKNHLLYEWKQSQQAKLDLNSTDKLVPLFETNKLLIILKDQIVRYMNRFEYLFQKNEATNGDEIEQVREKLLVYLKDYEGCSNQIKQSFYGRVNNALKLRPEFVDNERLINNVYRGSVFFLQDNLVKFKLLSDKLSELTQMELEDSKNHFAQIEGVQISKNSPTPIGTPEPRLTKKQIRELREQLMVMNEQRFLVENLIDDTIKQRKFDELGSLKENKTELIKRINELEKELGEFGF